MQEEVDTSQWLCFLLLIWNDSMDLFPGAAITYLMAKDNRKLFTYIVDPGSPKSVSVG
jgi:hypothetical protein